MTEVFSIRIGPQFDETDDTIAWKYDVPYVSDNEKYFTFKI